MGGPNSNIPQVSHFNGHFAGHSATRSEAAIPGACPRAACKRMSWLTALRGPWDRQWSNLSGGLESRDCSTLPEVGRCQQIVGRVYFCHGSSSRVTLHCHSGFRPVLARQVHVSGCPARAGFASVHATFWLGSGPCIPEWPAGSWRSTTISQLRLQARWWHYELWMQR